MPGFASEIVRSRRSTADIVAVRAPTTLPDERIEDIVVHELCHMHPSDHTVAFWNEVDKILPDYEERKEWLRKNGAGWISELDR